MMCRVLFLGSLLISMLAIPAFGIDPVRTDSGVFSARAEELFALGLEAYESELYGQAREHFQQLLELSLNQRSSAGQLMYGRTLFRLGEYALALASAAELEVRFPGSRYGADARLLVGDCYYVLQRYHEAVAQYGRILVTPAPLAVQARAAERLAAIVENGQVDDETLTQVRATVGNKRLRETLLFGRARWYRRLGWEVQSRALLATYLDSVPEGIFTSLAAQNSGLEGTVDRTAVQPLRNRQRSHLRRYDASPRLGLVLPLSGTGPQRQVGEDLYAGVQLANEQMGEPFELVVADIGIDYGNLQIDESEGSRLLRVVQQTGHLIEEEGVLAIIGPVFSSDCVAAAAVAEMAGVPLIAPLAQQSGLDLLGDFVFQLSTISPVQGRALGEYATLVLGLRTLAVIAPLTDYGWEFEREFSRVAHANGGDVIHVDWYFPEVTKDFRRIFQDIRQAGFDLESHPPADMLHEVDSPMASETSSLLYELLADLEEEVEVAAAETPADSSEIFIDTIDGIVIVVESFADAETIVPQLHFYRLQTQILGNHIWHAPEAIRQMRSRERSYIEGAIFVSGDPEASQTTRDFADAFRYRFARNPGYAAYGYDAARLVIDGWNQDGKEPGALRDWLARLRNFDGASGPISFSPDRRTNQELVLLKIDQRGRLRSLNRGDLPELKPVEYLLKMDRVPREW